MEDVIPMAHRRHGLPPEGLAILSLLGAIANPELRRYVIDQLGAAETTHEAAAAIALARALGRGEAAGGVPPPEGRSDLGQGPTVRVR